MIKIELSDGSVLNFEHEVMPREIAANISKELEKKTVGALINGKELIDNMTPINEDASVRLITTGDEKSLKILRHSTAHVLAKAVSHIYRDAKFAIGPATDDGFYYDFDLSSTIGIEDLPRIEKEMKAIIGKNEKFKRENITRERARELFKDQPYKLEILKGISKNEPITVYWLGSDYVDLCKGPHIESSGMIKAFKLLSVAGAYWRGNSRNKMLQRIYGTSFWAKKDLKRYLYVVEEAKKRDHRVLGKQLDLFSFQEEAGPGLVFWHPKGAIIRRQLEEWTEKEHEKRGYQRVYIPHIMKADLWKRSGHYDFYRENMFFVPVVEHEENERLGNEDVPLTCDEIKLANWYAVKPMNCPGHILIYKSKVRSYRDLPLRMFEFGTVYRYEKSGSLHGLLRVRGFTQDDGHIFCTPDQLKSEIQGVIDYVMKLLSTFNLDYVINVGTKPKKYIGKDEDWELATSALIDALKERGFEYNIVEGDGAFYGPKIDLAVLDALGRKWDGPTIQVDFNLPERFNVTYVDKDGKEKRPIMIHRAIMGSIERFVGLLIEHYAGLFPLWLAPVQAIILPVSDKHVEYADKVFKALREKGIRIEMDDEDAKLGYKVRKAEVQKVPYIVVVGEKEEKVGKISVRSKRDESVKEMDIDEFIGKLLSEIKNKV